MSPNDWLHVTRGDAPLVVSIPHAGALIPSDIEARLVSPWLARKDADWWLPELYAFAGDLGATVVRTGVSRTVIDVNRDPSGVSLYPGQATTGLCPVDTFDGEPLYREGQAPDAAEIAQRRVVRSAPDRRRRGRLRRHRPAARHQRPVQGRLDHAPLRSAGARRPRRADGAGLSRLHRRAGGADAGHLAHALPRPSRRAAAGRAH